MKNILHFKREDKLYLKDNVFFKMCHVIRRLLLFHQSPFDEFLHAIKEIGGTHAKQQNHAR